MEAEGCARGRVIGDAAEGRRPLLRRTVAAETTPMLPIARRSIVLERPCNVTE
jgi:hypothetical protein